MVVSGYIYQWSVQEPLSPRLATGYNPVDHWCSLSALFIFSLAPNLVCLIIIIIIIIISTSDNNKIGCVVRGTLKIVWRSHTLSQKD